MYQVNYTIVVVATVHLQQATMVRPRSSYHLQPPSNRQQPVQQLQDVLQVARPPLGSYIGIFGGTYNGHTGVVVALLPVWVQVWLNPNPTSQQARRTRQMHVTVAPNHLLWLDNPPIHAPRHLILELADPPTHASNPVASNSAASSNAMGSQELDLKVSLYPFASIPTKVLEMEFLACLVVIMIRHKSAGVTTARDNFTGFVAMLLFEDEDEDKSNSE
jgi:hypothetical protein